MQSATKSPTKTHLRAVDEEGNDPFSWDLSAQALLTSWRILLEQREIAEDAHRKLHARRGVSLAPQASQTFWVELMLLGLALENLFKGYWVTHKCNALYANGKLIRWKQVQPHDLTAIADHVNFSVNSRERTLLKMLSRIMTGVGRYPLTTRQQKLADGIGWSNKNDEVMQQLIIRLRTYIRALRD